MRQTSAVRTIVRWNRAAMSLQTAVLVSLVAGGLGLVGLFPAEAQSVDSNQWEANGPVYASARSGKTLYIGGDFTYLGPYTGGGVPVAAAGGSPMPGFPRIGGTVRAVAADGAGGWFIGGAFDSVGGRARMNLAHIRADLTVGDWNPGASGARVLAVIVSDGKVYVGGSFSNVGGQERSCIAAIDAETGLVSSWNPGANAEIWTLAASGGTVYAGGDFTFIGGEARTYIAALDVSTGLATAWNPAANSWLQSIAVSGSTVYAAGNFTSIGGQMRNRIAALDAATGLATPWDPSANEAVLALAVDGNTVYVGGRFSWDPRLGDPPPSIGGQLRNGIAALDAVTGLATPWNPNIGGQVFVLVVSGSTVFVGGEFVLAAVDVVSGQATQWNTGAIASTTSRTAVWALSADAGVVYVGGEFTSLGGQYRSRIAALDMDTGRPTAWNPGANGAVRALAVSGNTVYAGGDFADPFGANPTIGGQPRNYIAALDATTGLGTPWNPDADSRILGLAVTEGTVYAGGWFTTIGGQARDRIAALDATTGMATAWNPGASSRVWTLAVDGGTVYAGGEFTSIGGQARSRIAALDATSGLATEWDPNASSIVATLAVSGDVVCAGGSFTNIGGQPRNRIAALSIADGLATAWDPNASGGVIRTLVAGPGVVYAGGGFTWIGGQPRDRIAALDAATGAATAWNIGANNHVWTIAVGGGRLYAGGQFTMIGGQRHYYLAGMPDDSRVIPMAFVLTPNTLNLASQGLWVTGFLEPPSPFVVSDIDIASIRLNGTVPVDSVAPTALGDHDGNGVPDLMVKFNRGAVELTVSEGDHVPVIVTGTVDGRSFAGTDSIRVRRGMVSAPLAGSRLIAGSLAQVRWDTPAGVHVQSAAVLFSADDGSTWNLEAHGLPNTGSYVWTVPGAGTDRARIAVVLVASADASGLEVDGVVGVSGRFTVTLAVGVGSANVSFALHGAVPNPSRGVNVSFSLANAEPARLAVYDVSGREVSAREVGPLGAGRHVVSFGAAGRLAPGIYLVRLVQGDRKLVARAVVIR